MLSKLLLALGCSLFNPFTIWTSPAEAGTVSQPKVNKTQIELAFNEGVFIELANTNHVIKKVWLDNPTFGAIDFDGCLSNYNGCKDSDSKLIHLKRIQDLVLEKIPPANSTLMTIITEDPNTKARDKFFFRVVKAERSKQTLFLITPDAAPAPTVADEPAVSLSGLPPNEVADKIKMALQNPQVKAKVERPVKEKLQRFAYLIENGTQEANALKLADVNPQLLREVLNFKY